jgi:hypothetical protein
MLDAKADATVNRCYMTPNHRMTRKADCTNLRSRYVVLLYRPWGDCLVKLLTGKCRMSLDSTGPAVPTLIIGYARGYRHPAYHIKVAGRGKTCCLHNLRS